MLDILRNEDTSKSLENLTGSEEQYLFPGYFGGDIVSAQNDLEVMLSNRRSVKVIQSVASLPETESNATCSALFSKAFDLHTNSFHAAMRHIADPKAPRNEQSLVSTKLAISVALFASAESGNLQLLQEQLNLLSRWHSAMAPLAALPPPGKPPYVFSLPPALVGPDNRLIVNILRIAAWRSQNEVILKRFEAECGKFGMRSHQLPIVAWDATTTAFEILPDSPLDTSRGVVSYVVQDWPSELGSLDYGARDRLERELIVRLESIVFAGR